jgi:hypothetical protein
MHARDHHQQSHQIPHLMNRVLMDDWGPCANLPPGIKELVLVLVKVVLLPAVLQQARQLSLILVLHTQTHQLDILMDSLSRQENTPTRAVPAFDQMPQVTDKNN